MGSKNDLDTLAKLASDRASIPSFVVGFLRSMKRSMALPRFFEQHDVKEAEEDVVREVGARVVVSTVSALETLFRDCFVYLCERDPEFRADAVKSTGGQLTVQDVATLLDDKPLFSDLLAAQRNFQHLDTVNAAFAPFFGKKLWSVLDEDIVRVVTRDERDHTVDFHPISLGKIRPSWRKDLYALVQERHEIIHNAHHLAMPYQDDVRRWWQSALVAGQMLGIQIAERGLGGAIGLELPLDFAVACYVAANLAAAEGDMTEAYQLKKGALDQEAVGALGPFLFMGKELMRTRFDDQTGARTGRVNHILKQEEDGGLSLTTLREMKKDATSEESTSVGDGDAR